MAPSTAPPVSRIKVPFIEDTLLNHLEDIFKFLPSKGHDLRSLDRAVGHREVLDHLWGLLRAQENT